jgi:hypothetical protein
VEVEMSEAIIASVKELLTPFTGRQQLEGHIHELEAKLGYKIMQVIILSSKQMQAINTRSMGCEYYVDKTRTLTGELLSVWHDNDKDGIGKAVLALRDFVTEGKEAGLDEPSKDN